MREPPGPCQAGRSVVLTTGHPDAPELNWTEPCRFEAAMLVTLDGRCGIGMCPAHAVPVITAAQRRPAH